MGYQTYDVDADLGDDDVPTADHPVAMPAAEPPVVPQGPAPQTLAWAAIGIGILVVLLTLLF